MIDRNTDIKQALRMRREGVALKSRQRGFLLNPYRFGAASPYWANTVVLLHFSGANNSTTIIDSSSTGRTMTANGDAKITTADSVFGGSSLTLDGSGDYVSTPSTANLNMGSSDFCCEFRFCPAVTMNSSTGQIGLVSKWANNPNLEWMCDYYAGDLRFVYTNGSTTYTSNYTANFTAGVWYAVALNRSGSTFRLLVDGTSRATTTNGITIPSTSVNFEVGRVGNGLGAFSGKIDEVRVLKGAGPRNASYTVDTAAFPDA